MLSQRLIKIMQINIGPFLNYLNLNKSRLCIEKSLKRKTGTDMVREIDNEVKSFVQVWY